METGRAEHFCYVCCKNLIIFKYLRCKTCTNVYYCDNSCKAKGMGQLKASCESISWLLKVRADKVSKAVSYQTSCSLKEKPKMAKLVGYLCIIQYLINNSKIPILMDTGAQVLTIKGKYLNENFPQFNINPVQALLVSSDSLRTQWYSRGFVN